uniref:ATP synthase F0 subunit 8 n=2 Tax=Tetranychus TaxID=32263 RepID=E0AE46_TETCI|nr:ATP synthase F0 subunit 8 [Tetranychus cinnabarinus]YP_009051483.1 ATP synthase F0 subunit 8 [Tetranychus kanzawai]ADK89665.1 ATP synthase F0 subunit 8 [Tetranychus cinnabarinus]AIH15644.1 ATP synthase F0 subunit 8 [Tetranychus kanzawai]
MYQISPMNWIIILFLVFFLISYLYTLMNSFEKKSFYFNLIKKI